MACACGISPRMAGTGSFFSRSAGYYARKNRLFGLEKIQRNLLEGLRGAIPPTATILDIGCGIGALHLELLERGAVSAVAVDVSEGMIAEAKKAAHARGVEDRIRYINGDLADMQVAIDPADVTLMDKVVCCYEDLPRLLSKAMASTHTVLALTHPRNRAVVRWAFGLQKFLARVFHARFHALWHDWDQMREQILQGGFTQLYERSTLSWTALVFRRTP